MKEDERSERPVRRLFAIVQRRDDSLDYVIAEKSGFQIHVDLMVLGLVWY